MHFGAPSLDPARVGLPPTAGLSLAMFGTQFAAGIGAQQVARIEPVHGAREREYRRQRPTEFWILGAPMMPERAALGNSVETQQFFHAAVAIRRHDEHRSWECVRRIGESQYEIMVKLALLPVMHMFGDADRALQLVEQRAQPQVFRESLENIGHSISTGEDAWK